MLVVEDEALLRLDLEDILVDLGCEIAGSAGQMGTALALANRVACDAAVLDVNIANERVDPVADKLAERGIPFVFTTGYGDSGQPARHASAPLIEKPYSVKTLGAALAQLRAR